MCLANSTQQPTRKMAYFTPRRLVAPLFLPYRPGVLGTASFAAGIVSGWCPPPGPALMAVLLVRGRSGALVGAGEWRATAALITFSACILRMGLLLLENGASVGPMPEVSRMSWG